MTTTNTLTPSYIDIDFDTAKTNLKALLSVNPVFKDFDLEGANITVMIELIAYLVSLNTYYMNTIAKNVYPSTSNIYETTHMLAELGGYSPKGYRSASAEATLTMNVSALSAGGYYDNPSDEVVISEWSLLKNSTGITNIDTGEPLTFVVTDETTSYPISAFSLSSPTATINVREGSLVRYDYKGTDIIDNRIYLPVNTYDYGTSDYLGTIKIYVNETVQWVRLPDWYGFEEDDDSIDYDNAFMFKYDKYERYYVEFSDTRNIPSNTDTISIYAIVSSGDQGNVGEGVINAPKDKTTFLGWSTTYIPDDYYTLYNNNAATGGSVPDTIEEIKTSTIGYLHSQYRNVTKNDYISFLEERSNVIKANVWGEQEQAPSGSVLDYNNVYISVIPNEWTDGTCNTLRPSDDSDVTTVPCSATDYATTYYTDISEYLKPRKILTARETYVVPELLYIQLTLGLKIKTNYSFTNVATDVQNKLLYYFSTANRSFGEIISFTDLSEYILDSSIKSTDNDFTNVKGLRTLVIRDIVINRYLSESPYYESVTISEPPGVGEEAVYPYYADELSDYYDNNLRRIQLGYNQFPLLHLGVLSFVLEE